MLSSDFLALARMFSFKKTHNAAGTASPTNYQLYLSKLPPSKVSKSKSPSKFSPIKNNQSKSPSSPERKMSKIFSSRYDDPESPGITERS